MTQETYEPPSQQLLRASISALQPGSVWGGARLTATDILGRELPPLYSPRARLLVKNSVVLVTGAGGSIGSELVRQMHHLGAARVICVNRDEYALYRLQLGLTGQAMLTDDSTVLADVASSTADGSGVCGLPTAARFSRCCLQATAATRARACTGHRDECAWNHERREAGL